MVALTPVGLSEDGPRNLLVNSAWSIPFAPSVGVILPELGPPEDGEGGELMMGKLDGTAMESGFPPGDGGRRVLRFGGIMFGSSTRGFSKFGRDTDPGFDWVGANPLWSPDSTDPAEGSPVSMAALRVRGDDLGRPLGAPGTSRGAAALAEGGGRPVDSRPSFSEELSERRGVGAGVTNSCCRRRLADQRIAGSLQEREGLGVYNLGMGARLNEGPLQKLTAVSILLDLKTRKSNRSNNGNNEKEECGAELPTP